MGLLPTAHQIGAFAPALLVSLRIIQGIAVGGEWGGAMLLAFESAPRKNEALLQRLLTWVLRLEQSSGHLRYPGFLYCPKTSSSAGDGVFRLFSLLYSCCWVCSSAW